MSVIDNARDNRTKEQLQEAIERGNRIGKIAINAFCSYLFEHSPTFDPETHFVWYDDYLVNDPSELGGKKIQDCDLHHAGKTTPIEVKVCEKGFSDIIYIRPYTIFKLAKMGGYTLLAELEYFSFISCASILKDYQIQECEIFGNKKCFVIPKVSLGWGKFDEALNLTSM